MKYFSKADKPLQSLDDTVDYDKHINSEVIDDQVSFSINSASWKSKRILIVDDEPYNLIAMKIVLEQAEKKLLQKNFNNDVLNKTRAKISDIIDQASNGLDAFEKF